MIRTIARRLILVCAATLSLSPAKAQTNEGIKLSHAPPRAVRLYVSGSMRAPVLAVRAEIEKATGRALVFESSESRTLQKEIESGQPFEVALLTDAVIADLTAKGHLVVGSAQRLSVVRIGVAVRGTSRSFDVTTVAGLKSAILGAHSIRRYYGVAASTPIVDNLFAKLDLADATKGRLIALGTGTIPLETPLNRGEYELIINLASAVVPMKGWHYLGLIPEEFQRPVFHSAALGISGDHALGSKLINVLKSPAFDAALKANGVSRR